jgi:hypothetical protein
MNLLSLIVSLEKEGKSPLEIARELHARGLKGRGGHVFTPADVEGFLRFIGVAGIEVEAGRKISQATWGSRGAGAQASAIEPDDAAGPEKKRKNRWNPGNALPDELKAKITRLYQHEHLRSNEIAERLGLPLRKVAPFCAVLSGFPMPPGEVTVIIDEDGRKITRCPPGYAKGAAPQRNIRPTQGGW